MFSGIMHILDSGIYISNTKFAKPLNSEIVPLSVHCKMRYVHFRVLYLIKSLLLIKTVASPTGKSKWQSGGKTKRVTQGTHKTAKQVSAPFLL